MEFTWLTRLMLHSVYHSCDMPYVAGITLLSQLQIGHILQDLLIIKTANNLYKKIVLLLKAQAIATNLLRGNINLIL